MTETTATTTTVPAVYSGIIALPSLTSEIAANRDDVTVQIVVQQYGLSFTLPFTVSAGTGQTATIIGSRVPNPPANAASPTTSGEFEATVTFSAPNYTPRLSFQDVVTITATPGSSTSLYIPGGSSAASPTGSGSSATAISSSISNIASSGDTPQASQTTSSASSTSTQSSSSKNLSGGAIGGIIVGALLVVALIAAFLFLRLRKQRKKRTDQYASKTPAYHNTGTDGEAYVLAAGTKAGWQKNLPQPESDQTITQLANRTLDAIELFVENYYSDQPSRQLQGTASSDMASFNSPHLSHPLSSVIPASRSPTVLIKHCLAYYLLQKIDPTRNNSQSLLPSEYVIPAKGDQQALSQLRTRIAQKSNIDQDEHYLARRNQVSEATTQQIEQAFQLWARGDRQDRMKSLRGILTHLSEMGNKFFSQAANFEWRWDANRKLLPHQLVMLPGLDKTTDSEAVPLARPIRLVEPRLGKYGE